ncbi:MAG: CBS domain-containing protein [Myxococcales bacterium]|nr:CBS domain-containing protein [Myxococcales bacterium]
MRETRRSHVPTARDVMSRNLVTFTTDMEIFQAIRTLLKNRISGGPVVDGQGRLLGMLSELDCLRILSAGEFYSDDHREEGHVGDYMTSECRTIDPGIDLYALAQVFQTHAVRRLPVVENGELLGQVSRRDVLKAMEQLGAQRSRTQHYPDYRAPAEDVGAARRA